MKPEQQIIHDNFIKAVSKSLYEAWIKTIPEEILKGLVKPGSEETPLTNAEFIKEPCFPIIEKKR